MRDSFVVVFALIATFVSGCSGEAVPESEPAELACPVRGIADAHLESQPRFETPEEALAWVVENSPLTAPATAYSQVAVGGGVGFRYHESGDEHHTFEFVERNGGWVFRARSGCLPDYGHPE